MGNDRDAAVVLDLGTSAVKAHVLDINGTCLNHSSRPAPPIADDGISFRVGRYLDAVIETLRALPLTGVSPTAIAVSGQRATAVLLDPHDLESSPAFSWQIAAPVDATRPFYDAVGRDRFLAVTGLPPSGAYTCAKLAWLHRNGDLPRGSRRRICTLADAILNGLGGGELVTDPSHASTTGLFACGTETWTDELLAPLGIGAACLPRIVPSGTVVGTLAKEVSASTGLPVDIPLILAGGDHQCALLGAGARQPGDAVLSTGTSAALLHPLGHLPDTRAQGILLLAHVLHRQWVLEGFMIAFGSALQWAAAMLGATGPTQLAKLAESAGDAAWSIDFLPFIAGSGSPDLRADATGAWTGLSITHTRADLAKAVFNGLAFEVTRILDVCDALAATTHIHLLGPSNRAGPFCQTLADITRRPVSRCVVPHPVATGAAALAWTARDRFPSVYAAVDAMTSPATAVAHPCGDDRGEPYRRHCRNVAALRTQASP